MFTLDWFELSLAAKIRNGNIISLKIINNDVKILFIIMALVYNPVGSSNND